MIVRNVSGKESSRRSTERIRLVSETATRERAGIISSRSDLRSVRAELDAPKYYLYKLGPPEHWDPPRDINAGTFESGAFLGMKNTRLESFCWMPGEMSLGTLLPLAALPRGKLPFSVAASRRQKDHFPGENRGPVEEK